MPVLLPSRGYVVYPVDLRMSSLLLSFSALQLKNPPQPFFKEVVRRLIDWAVLLT